MKKFFAFLGRTLVGHKVFIRTLSMILDAVMFFYVIPTVVYGEIADAINSIDSGSADTSDSELSYSYNSDVYEITELREENVKHFRLEDGRNIAASYNYPVHVLDDDGRYVDIDNTLRSSWGVYATPNARIKFAKKITGNETFFTLHDGNTKLTFSLNGALKGSVGKITNSSDAPELGKLQKMMNLEKLSSRIYYADILPGTDIEYVADSLNIKENIIVKEKQDTVP